MPVGDRVERRRFGPGTVRELPGENRVVRCGEWRGEQQALRKEQGAGLSSNPLFFFW